MQVLDYSRAFIRSLSYHMNEKITNVPYPFALKFELKSTKLKLALSQSNYIDRLNFLSHVITVTIAYIA